MLFATPSKEVVAKGQIPPPTVILATVGIHFSPHTPDFEGVEKGLNPRLFPFSVIFPAKEGVDCEMDPRPREDDGQQCDSTFCDTLEGGRRKRL